jgi:hypothetical protein
MSKILTVFTAPSVPLKRGMSLGVMLLFSFLAAALGFAGFVLLHGPK